MDSPIVGATWLRTPPLTYPAGLHETQAPGAHPPTYRTVFFGATRDYVDDEDGWQTVHYTSKKGRRKAARRNWLGSSENTVTHE